MWRKNLGLRLTLFLGLTLVLFVGLLVGALATNHRSELLREITFSTQRLAATVKRSIRHDMLTLGHTETQKTLRAIGTQEGIERIRIFSKDGAVISSSVPEEIGTMVDKQAEACYQCHASETPLVTLNPPKGSRLFRSPSGQRLLGVIEVFYNEPACWNAACHAHPKEQKVLGVLDVAVSLQDMDRRLAKSTALVACGSLLFVVVLCLVVALLSSRVVRRPIQQLLRGMHKVASGDFRSLLPVYGEDEISQLTSAFNDMTEKLTFHIHKLTETQQKLFHAQKLASLGKLAAGVAHELNSPLTVILNDSSLLLRRFPKGSSEREELKTIAQEAKRCGEIIHGLLEFTRLERPRKECTDLNTLLRDTCALVRHQARLNEVEMQLDLSPHLPPVEVDPNQIKQVFLDILTNAFQAMPEGGKLSIRTTSDPATGAVCASFTDTGCGIPPEHVKKIFDPFFTTKDARTGTGLGLAICYEIVEKHGGTIAVESSLGKGSTFTVRLPSGRLPATDGPRRPEGMKRGGTSAAPERHGVKP